jgi:hypothetical protein
VSFGAYFSFGGFLSWYCDYGGRRGFGSEFCLFLAILNGCFNAKAQRKAAKGGFRESYLLSK